MKTVSFFFKSRFDTPLQAVARRHPLGFFYATEALSDAMMLRYHLWPSDWAVPTQEEGNDIHDHVYELNSLLVAGMIRHETFDAVPANEGSWELFDVIYTDEASALSGTQRIELRTASNHLHTAATAYRLRPGVLHRATPEKLPLATLVLTIRSDRRAAAHVAVKRGKQVATDFHRAPLSVDEVVKARTSLGRLEAQSTV